MQSYVLQENAQENFLLVLQAVVQRYIIVLTLISFYPRNRSWNAKLTENAEFLREIINYHLIQGLREEITQNRKTLLPFFQSPGFASWTDIAEITSANTIIFCTIKGYTWYSCNYLFTSQSETLRPTWNLVNNFFRSCTFCWMHRVVHILKVQMEKKTEIEALLLFGTR